MFENFEKKILEIKEKTNPKMIAVISFFIFGITMLYGMQMANMFKREKQKAQDGYNKAMYEIISYAQNVDSLLTKARVTTTAVESSKIYSDIWRQAGLAKENLASIPVNQQEMQNASLFLGQTSDYAYAMLKQTVSGTKLTDTQYQELGQLNKASSDLTTSLNNIYEDLNSGRLKWDEVENAAAKQLEEGKEESGYAEISKISNSFKNYAGLIYDGAFSNHIDNIKPKMLTGEEITKKEAELKVKKILEANKNNKIEKIEYKGESKGNLNVYIFDVKYSGSDEISNVEITKDTGLVSLIVRDRKINNKKINEFQAIKAGKDFLRNMGMGNMKNTYYTIQDNMITINYAAVQDDILLYPDLIKVKIAMDNSEVCSIEALGYIFNHTKRTDIVPTITINQARNVLNKNIKVEQEGLAIIPTDSRKEVLTYEFKGKIMGKDFLVYINAKTGVEEQILIVLDTGNGILTM